jgi:DNA-binding transcriptional ArsR family regulator
MSANLGPTPESIARFASLLADRSRVSICLALLDGRAWTAGELARSAGIGRSTASEHLTLLVEAGLLADERQGRHRYVRLANAEIAQLVEDLAVAFGERARPTSLRAVRASHALAAGRTCYDHVAGALGVAIYDALVRSDLIAARDGLALTPAGRSWFVELAGGDALEQRGARPLLRTCLDFTERRPHLGGRLGALLCEQLVERGWVVRASEHRALTVTPRGAQGLRTLFGDAFPLADDVGAGDVEAVEARGVGGRVRARGADVQPLARSQVGR